MSRISFLGLDVVAVGWIVLRNRTSAERGEVACRESRQDASTWRSTHSASLKKREPV